MPGARKTAPARKPPPAGPKALRGSPEAKRKAALFLEALTGLRTTQSASDTLGIALARYYVLEARMLQAMIDALEPRERGRKRSLEREIVLRDEENRRLEREVRRLQSLYRTTQRALGVPRDSPGKGGAKKEGGPTTKVRRPRRKTRGQRVVEVLRGAGTGETEAESGATLDVGDRRGGEP